MIRSGGKRSEACLLILLSRAEPRSCSGVQHACNKLDEGVDGMEFSSNAGALKGSGKGSVTVGAIEGLPTPGGGVTAGGVVATGELAGETGFRWTNQ